MIAAPLPAALPVPGTPFDAAVFAVPVGNPALLQWEDPREVHRVVVRLRGPGDPRSVHLEYWTSRWPRQRLPKDREPGGGDVGWWELGNWHTGGWRRADTEARTEGSAVVFTFRPVNAREVPEAGDFAARHRFTLKLRAVADDPDVRVERIEAFTDSVWQRRAVRVVRRGDPKPLQASAHNGFVEAVEPRGGRDAVLRLLVASNTDPNTFDRTLVTLGAGPDSFTFRPDDLAAGPIVVPHAGTAITEPDDVRTYGQIERAARNGRKSLVDHIAERPEQTWKRAWAGVPAKRSPIYLPLGLDGGRQRFRLNSDGSVELRTNDHYLRARPGRDTPRLDWEAGPVRFDFGLPDRPVHRTLVDETLPLCVARWEAGGVQVQQEAFVAPLEGIRPGSPPPAGDATAVLLARFTLHNPGGTQRLAELRLSRRAGDREAPLSVGIPGGILTDGRHVRGQVECGNAPERDGGSLRWRWNVGPGERATLVVKLPYVMLAHEEVAALQRLSFDDQWRAVSSWWRARLDRSARLLTPEPMLNEFHRAHAGHLLINCEREPGARVRFARVGSFGYGVYGNESCMMVVDLDRRGLHEEARECLDAWLKYQGTAALPGDFSSQDGVLYGAGGYEAGGYNQHHGWILWCLAEHYRFTRDRAWLKSAAKGILAGAEWIVRERARTAGRNDLARGLLPAGSLEDIQDWWPWLSTNCYTWRGLDSAAWALGQLRHPEAPRLRREARAYRAAILAAFREAARRAPVVRLRDGTCVPHFPSHVFRRGRTFGWICETLEGAIHLLITGLIPPHSREAEWILKDYEDNLFLSNQYGYSLANFERDWFGLGGMSMQSCLLLDVEPWLYRDDVKHALRALFNAVAVGYFPDVRLLTEHALPNPGDWRGDHYKTSDEANAMGWLRQIFVREAGETLLLGQAVPREWLRPGAKCGLERAATHFGPMSVVYSATVRAITARLEGPARNPPRRIRLRFRHSEGALPVRVRVNGVAWKAVAGDWVELPGGIGRALVRAEYR